MTSTNGRRGRHSFSPSFLFVIVALVVAFLALSAAPVAAARKKPAPAPAPSPALAEAAAARAKAAEALASSRAEAAAAAAAARALDDLPRGSGTRPHQLQYLGTHRSYRVAPPKAAMAFLRSKDGADALAAKNDPNAPALLAQILSPVTREPLAEQAEKGIRAFHLDAWGDGGGDDKQGSSSPSSSSSSLYAAGWAAPKLGGASSGGDRRGRGDADSAASTAALMRSNPRSFKVFSDPDFDGLSVCATLPICLADLKGWSDASPRHSPVVVFVEPRDEALFKGNDVARVGRKVGAAAVAAVAANGTEGADAAAAAAAPPPASASASSAASTFDELLKELTLSAGPTSLASPPKIDAAALVALDDEIRAALGGKRAANGAGIGSSNDNEAAAVPPSTPTLFTPEDLRAASNMSSGSLLARNVLARGGKGWPDVDLMKGRILVVIVGKHAALYAETMSKTKKGGGAGGKQAAFAAAPSQDAAGPDTLFLDLAPRALAVDQAGNPVAAPAKVLAKWEDSVSTAARSAFLVRASADFAGVEAGAFSSAVLPAPSPSPPSSSRAESVLRSGATFVMTDYPHFSPDPATGYSVDLKRGAGGGEETPSSRKKRAVALRCNPVTATKNPGSLSFAEVGCAAVPPLPPSAPKKPVEVSAGGGGEDASPESPPPPPANGDGPSPDDPYYGGDGALVVAAPAPAPPQAPLPPSSRAVSVVPAASKAAMSSASSPGGATATAAVAAVSTAARPKADAEGAGAAAAAEGIAAAPVAANDDAAVAALAPLAKRASWASPVDTSESAPLDADAAAVPPALAADDEAAAATTAAATATTTAAATTPTAPAAAAAAKPTAAASAPPAPRRPGYATPADAGERPTVSSSSSSTSSSSNAIDHDAQAVPRRRFLDPNAGPEASSNSPSFIPLTPSRIESGDAPDGGVVPAAASVAGQQQPIRAPLAATSATDGEVSPSGSSSEARRGGGAKKGGAADNHVRPRDFAAGGANEDEEANSHTGDAALAMPSLLP